jgi:hypothetical protein
VVERVDYGVVVSIKKFLLEVTSTTLKAWGYCGASRIKNKNRVNMICVNPLFYW